MHTHKIINIHPAQIPLQNNISKELKISKILAQLLINRGIKTHQEAQDFLNAKPDSLHDPFSFTDMHKARDLVRQAAKDKDAVLLCGDYDVDGITSLALLKDSLVKIGINCQHYIPHRIKDGYGLNKNVLQIAKEKKIKLLITVDCGTSSYALIKSLRDSGTEVIVTDHHEPVKAELPPASAIINPKIKESNYKYRELAGVGVAYKFAQAVTGEKLTDELDLVALGTIADVVPLTGENRIFVKEGLKRINYNRSIGISALIETSRLRGKKINTTFVSFILGPRLNASGRMDSAETSLKLLLSKDKQEAILLAQAIEACNRQRQKIEGQILEEALGLINKEINFKEHKVIVVAKEGWHQGVLGIVASKLADKFYRPTIVISLNEQLCKGSGRSIKNFHLFQALCDCKEYLEDFGGHRHAVGLLVNRNNLEDFRKQINHLAQKKLLLEDLIPSIEVDMEVELSDLNIGLVQELDLLEPYGTANPEPLLFTRGLRLKGEPRILGRETLKFWVTDGSSTQQVIGFGMSSFSDSLLNAKSLDLVYTPKLDSWQEVESLILEAKEVSFG